jgi:hypothetical protein
MFEYDDNKAVVPGLHQSRNRISMDRSANAKTRAPPNNQSNKRSVKLDQSQIEVSFLPEKENREEVPFNPFKFSYNLEGVDVQYPEEVQVRIDEGKLKPNKIDKQRFADPAFLLRQ